MAVPLFYDQYEGIDLWGRDLAVYFDEVYRKQSRYVVVFASANYLAKVWPKRELQSALAGAITQAGTRCSRNRLARLMSELLLQGRHRRRWKRTTVADREAKIASQIRRWSRSCGRRSS